MIRVLPGKGEWASLLRLPMGAVPSSTKPFTGRFRFLDAARGSAMLLVLLSHFGGVYFRSAATSIWPNLFARIGMIASPLFVIISGVLLGVQFQTAGDGFSRIANKLIDRGLFLLLIAHPLICAALLPYERTFLWSLSTDAIGMALILGVVIVPRMSPANRLSLSLVAFAVTWLAVDRWRPMTWHAIAGKEALFGTLSPTIFKHGTFPMIAWFSVYLASTVLGERLANLHRSGRTLRALHELTLLSTIALTSSAVVLIGRRIFLQDSLLGDTIRTQFPLTLLRTGQKYPPGPEYLLFYGGLGLALLAALLALDIWNVRARILERIAVFGETSLFVFIAHFYMYWIVLNVIGPGTPALWALYFVPSILIMMIAASAWRHGKYNFLFTVGYSTLVHRLSLKFRPRALVTGASSI